ncbi:MAG TPA: hypothetical protein VMR98_00310, partial [Candidatus Polarisedimenticolaceae bacterium]|nr:hypothetical protein [Candidatus Polarisedimenticolaceae bacterium]
MTNVKAIIFDCFGVLYNDPGLDLILPRVGASTDEYYQLSRAFDLGVLSKTQYFADLARISNLDTGQVV